jgi:glutamate synthase domain-containing protein 2
MNKSITTLKHFYEEIEINAKKKKKRKKNKKTPLREGSCTTQRRNYFYNPGFIMDFLHTNTQTNKKERKKKMKTHYNKTYSKQLKLII